MYWCTWVQQGDSFGRSHRLPSLLLLSTLLTGQVHMHLYSAQLPFHMTWCINTLDCLTLFSKTTYHLISLICISSFFSILFLLKMCYSAAFLQDVLAQPLTHQPSPMVCSKPCQSLYLYPVFAFSGFLHNTGTTNDWWEELDLGSGCTVTDRLSGVHDQQLTMSRQNTLGRSAVMSCAWELTLLFSVAFYISFYCCHKLNAKKMATIGKL